MAPPSASRWLAACCAVLASSLVTSCGGSSGSGPPPPPPTELSLVPGAGFDELVVTWTPPPTPVDGFELQLRLESDPWQTLQGDLPGSAIGAFVTLAAAVPELVTISGRVRAWKSGRASGWSGEASAFRGLRAPADGVATLDDFERLRLTWSQPSTAATDVRIERARYDDASSTWSAWAVVDTVPAASASWLDASGLEPNVAYQYRITNLATWHGTVVESGEVAISGWRTSVAPPAGLAAALEAGTARLTWSNRSGSATAIRVERADGLVGADANFGLVATLPPDAITWSEVLAPGAYTYRVAAVAGAVAGASAPVQLLAPPAGFDGSVLRLPQVAVLARDPAGAWWIGSSAPPPLRLMEPSAAAWTRHDLPSAGWEFAQPGVVLGPGARRHLLFLEQIPGTTTTPAPTDLAYEWFDGTSWTDEVIARRTFDWNGASEPQAWMALDEEGTPHAAWNTWGRDFPEHAVRTDAGWTVETLASTLYDPTLAFDVAGFGAAPDGTLYLLIDAWSKLVLWSRPDGGSWSEELVPVGSDLEVSAPRVLLPGATGVTVVYTGSVYADALPRKVRTITRTGATWGAVTEVAAYDAGGVGGVRWPGAASGTRAAFLVPQAHPEGLWLYAREGTGAWQATRLGQTTGWSPSWLGFDAAGKLWVLSPGTPGATAQPADPAALLDYLLYAEP